MTAEPIEQPDVELIEVPTVAEAAPTDEPAKRSGLVPALVFSALVLGLGVVGLVHLLGGAGMAVAGAVTAGVAALMAGAKKYKGSPGRRRPSTGPRPTGRKATGLRMPGLPSLGRGGRSGGRTSAGKRGALKIPKPRLPVGKNTRRATAGKVSGAKSGRAGKRVGSGKRVSVGKPLRGVGGKLRSGAAKVSKGSRALLPGKRRRASGGVTGSGKPSSAPKRKSLLRRAAKGAVGFGALPFAMAAAKRQQRRASRGQQSGKGTPGTGSRRRFRRSRKVGKKLGQVAAGIGAFTALGVGRVARKTGATGARPVKAVAPTVRKLRAKAPKARKGPQPCRDCGTPVPFDPLSWCTPCREKRLDNIDAYNSVRGPGAHGVDHYFGGNVFAPAQPTPPITPKGTAMLNEAHDPDGMLDFERSLQTEAEQAEEYAAKASAFRDMCDSELPLNAMPREAIQAYADTWQLLAEQAQEMAAAFASAHEDDKERLENPRPGEELWDTSRNDA